jgi:ATP-dependent exoDNAse (exonuclease V) alpha subunit
MADYHLSVKVISRSDGRTATAAAAYRAADKILELETGQIHDYTRKEGVVLAKLILPENAPKWAHDREQLWNAAEASERRKNSTVAREFEIGLPAELSPFDREKLALDFAKEIMERHGVAVDCCIHKPNKGGDQRNHHAHILTSTRRLTPDGFGEKSRELDVKTSGEVEYWRKRYATLQNERLLENGIDKTVSHLSLKAQGLEREPTMHRGPAATGYERRTGDKSRITLDYEQRSKEWEIARDTANELIRLELENETQQKYLQTLNNERASELEWLHEQKMFKQEEFEHKQQEQERLAEEERKWRFAVEKWGWQEGERERWDKKHGIEHVPTELSKTPLKSNDPSPF